MDYRGYIGFRLYGLGSDLGPWGVNRRLDSMGISLGVSGQLRHGTWQYTGAGKLCKSYPVSPIP